MERKEKKLVRKLSSKTILKIILFDLRPCPAGVKVMNLGTTKIWPLKLSFMSFTSFYFHSPQKMCQSRNEDDKMPKENFLFHILNAYYTFTQSFFRLCFDFSHFFSFFLGQSCEFSIFAFFHCVTQCIRPRFWFHSIFFWTFHLLIMCMHLFGESIEWNVKWQSDGNPKNEHNFLLCIFKSFICTFIKFNLNKNHIEVYWRNPHPNAHIVLYPYITFFFF